MGLNKLDNFIKNTEGRILYVNPNDLDSTDSISNQGNSLAQPFKTIQRALLESARFSYLKGTENDITEKTTILLFPGQHVIDNRPGYAIKTVGVDATAVSQSGAETLAGAEFSLTLTSNFDLTQSNNILHKFNSIHGGVIVPRGTSIVGLDLRKTKIRPKYVPNPTDTNLGKSAIFRITGACYFWQFSIFDGDESGLVYTDNIDFSSNNQSTPTFSHHKLTIFEYADGVNNPVGYNLTDLDMYYAKLSNAYNVASTRDIDQKYPSSSLGFSKQRPEWEIVGAFGTDPVSIATIESGSGGTAGPVVTVTTTIPHELSAGTPIKIKGVSDTRFNVSTKVQSVDIADPNKFTYLLSYVAPNLTANPNASNGTVTIETDTVSGASPYIFNISMRSVWGMCGMLADGLKASGFRSMVVAQFTGVSLQKDDRAFVKYNQSSRLYENIQISKVSGSALSSGSSSTNTDSVYHLDSSAIYRKGWDSTHIKLINDAFIQVVSVFAIGYTKHFEGQSGGDASITNSNSNFGENSLTAEGFKKEAFAKDNNAFITSIVGPKAGIISETSVDWIAFDTAKTISALKNNHLYLYGFTSKDDIPPNILQGYRVGAKVNEKVYLPYNGTNYEANVYLTDTFTSGNTTTGTTSSEKIYTATAESNNIFEIGTHKLTTGEKVRIFSDSADLPENIVENTVYYAIVSTSTKIKLASSYTNASLGQEITVYGGDSLKIVSRVSDKDPGDIGHPIQYDTVNSNWFVHTNANSDIYTLITTNSTVNSEPKTEVSYINRISDSRSLDDKLYKIRVVVPKNAINSRDPSEGFVIQESSSTGIGKNSYASTPSITISDINYEKNTRIIAKCSVNSSVVTVISETPHNLNVGDKVIIQYVTDTSNTSGADNIGYNGTFTVTNIDDSLTFRYLTTDIFGVIHSPGTFTNTVSTRNISLPRFSRNDLQSNYYIYRNDVITPYKYGADGQDGVYHLYVLNAKNTIQTEFTDFKYSQNVVNLYPQLDRDNYNDNPGPTKSYAKRFPLGEVSTNYLKNSITRETVDQFLQDFGSGLSISSVVSTAGIATITFDKEHGLAGIVTYSTLSAGNSYTDGIYPNVKLFNNNILTIWNGATSNVVVSGGGIVSVDIVSQGSAYTNDQTLYFDTTRIGSGNNGYITISTSSISIATGNVVQFTGAGTTSDGYYRIASVPAKNQITVTKTSTDPLITTDQYAFVVGPSITISSSSYSNGTTTFNCSGPHGLQAGNKFRVLDSSSNNLGDYVVDSRVDFDTFTAVTNTSISPTYILKHGLSSNYASSDSSGENIGVRDTTFFANEILTAVSFNGDDKIVVSSPLGGVAITKRFPLGSYIQIDSEIMRVSSSTLSGSGNNELSVLRGVLGTFSKTHDENSLIRKIKPLAIELRRPTIIRSSNQTFEYLGYGPGNYSTALPQVQVRSLTETETYLSQAQQRSCGAVIYTGMNSDGDFYIGNKKLNSKTGKEVIFDAPIPTITGENPSRLSVVFDEVTIKERLLVEGGASNKVLSQFDGPVTFNNEIKVNETSTFTKPVIIKDTTSSPNKNTGALIIKGGIGIAENLNVGGTLNITGTSTLNGEVTVNTGIVPDVDSGAYIGATGKAFSEAHIDGIRIGVAGTTTIDTRGGNLVLTAPTGSKVAISTSATINGNLDMTAGSGRISANYLDVPNVTPIGSVVMWCGTINNYPTGWAVCNGAELLIATYTTLYNVLTNSGTVFPFGANTNGSGGAGSTHFRMPNMVDKFVAGAGNAYSVGATGGSADAVVVSHTHSITDPKHSHTVGPIRAIGQGGDTWGVFGDGGSDVSTTEVATRITINSEGVSGTNQNLPPYFALIYLMRII